MCPMFKKLPGTATTLNMGICMVDKLLGVSHLQKLIYGSKGDLNIKNVM